jgi:hypothetical protein
MRRDRNLRNSIFPPTRPTLYFTTDDPASNVGTDSPSRLPNRPRPGRSNRGPRRNGDAGSTTFEKQYTDDELEFMNAIQQFKTQSGKSFPSYGEVLRIAARLGYRKSYPLDDFEEESSSEIEAFLPA